jgi:hypothetical protein
MAIRLYDKAIRAVRYFLLRKLPPCNAMVPLMSQSLERPLTLRERVTLKLHLWVCIWCVWYLEQVKLLGQTLRARGAQPDEDKISTSLSLSSDAQNRIKKALNQQLDVHR